MTKKEFIIKSGRKSGLPAKEIMSQLKEVRAIEEHLTEKVYGYIGEFVKNDQALMDFARHHYESYLKNDYPTFESWFEKSYYNWKRGIKVFKEGIEDWLGQLKYQDKLDEFLGVIKFQDFLDNMEHHCEVHFQYSDGRCPGSIWSMMIDPKVTIEVELLNE